MFIYIPYSYVVRPKDISRWSHRSHLNPYVIRYEVEKLKEFLEKYNIPFIDPTNKLISEDKKKRMCYFLDTHLTPDGNKVVAEESISVIQRILEENLIAK